MVSALRMQFLAALCLIRMFLDNSLTSYQLPLFFLFAYGVTHAVPQGVNLCCPVHIVHICMIRSSPPFVYHHYPLHPGTPVQAASMSYGVLFPASSLTLLVRLSTSLPVRSTGLANHLFHHVRKWARPVVFFLIRDVYCRIVCQRDGPTVVFVVSNLRFASFNLIPLSTLYVTVFNATKYKTKQTTSTFVHHPVSP
jgi:hypothetical protein